MKTRPQHGRSISSFIVSFIFGCIAIGSASSTPAHADTVETAEIGDWRVVGDGVTPTFLQYLDAQGFDFKPTKDLVTASAKGEAVYAFSFSLPPALHKPSLGLSYSSEAGLGFETAYGWSLDGIAEIRRPLARAFESEAGDREDRYDSEWLVSGPGFSGTLMPSGEDDYRYFLRATKPQLVSAEYDWDNDRWKIYADGVTYELSPKDDGADTPFGTATWRVDKSYDTSGNLISYSYDEDGRIEKISYGGNATTGADHLIDVNFLYAGNPVTRTSARGGFLIEYDKHITKITVGEAEPDSGSSSASKPTFGTLNQTGWIGSAIQAAQSDSPISSVSGAVVDATPDSDYFYAYDLVHDEVDSLDLLVELEREGATASDVETIATFAYSEFNDFSGLKESLPTSQRTSTSLPDFLGATEGQSQGSTRVDSYSYTTQTLVDINRDGLPDAIDSSDATSTNKVWKVRPRTVDHASRLLSWDGTIRDVTAVGGPLQAVTNEAPTSDAEYYAKYQKNHTTRQLVDVDGDGYVDILESDDEDEWIVRYGHGTGFASGTVEKPPHAEKYAQTVHAPKADNITTGTYDASDVINGLIDMNGDGWLDYFGDEGDSVYFHSGTRGGGWETTGRDYGGKIEAMRSVTYTIASESYKIDVDDYCQDMCEDCEEECTCADAEQDPDGACNYSVCEDACKDSAENSSRQKYVSATDEWQALYDMNGDGLPDAVASNGTPWRVAFNNGNGFEDYVDWNAAHAYSRRTDEGYPDVYWLSCDMGISQYMAGRPARVYQALLDVDGDGLPDLVLGKSHPNFDYRDKWYKNTGAGFETTPRNLPDWWPDDFMTSTSVARVDGDSGSSTSEGEITGMMIDLDHDGALDYLTTSSTSLMYGPYPGPYLLTQVENGQGGETGIVYRSLATVEPSGEFSEKQYTPIVKHLVDEVVTEDTLTGQTSETDFSYANGYYKDGVFQGFPTRSESRKLNGSWIGDAEFSYEIDRDYAPLLRIRKLYTDFNLGFGSSIKRGAATRSLRHYLLNTYGDYGDTGNFFRLPKTRKTVEYGEKSGSKTVTQTYAWDDYGNLTSHAHNGGGVAADAVTTAFEFKNDVSGDADYDAKFYRMKKKTVTGTDPIKGVSRVFFTEVYCYDNSCDEDEPLTKGLFTDRCTYSGWVDGGESLGDCYDVDFGRGSRGELVSVNDNETGIEMTQTFGFGGAVLETQTNGLGHNLTRVIDERGRVTSITDPNGLKLTTTYDAFDRVTKMEITGSDGTTDTLQKNAYKRASAPFYTMTQLYGDAGVVENTAYVLEDGFGGAAQTWRQDDSGHFLVTHAVSDLRGLTVATSHPEDKGTSFTNAVSIAVAGAFGKFYYDASGEAREAVRDAAKATGSQLVYHDAPWSELRQDENGYQTRLTYDAHRRVTKTAQGKGGTFTTTGTYRYDPMNRLVRFEDGKGTVYTYYYDGVGRLRAVYYGAKTLWYSYEYKGNLRTKMTDNTGATAEWRHDALGRVTSLTISDSLPSSTGTLSYTYDYDDAWIGALYNTTDPSGSTEYGYDAYGRESRVKRTYAAGLSGTQAPEFSYDRDLRGRLTAKTFPTGRELASTYAYGHLTSVSASTSGSVDYTLSYDYNKWGLIDSVTSSFGHRFSQTNTTPLWANKLKMRTGGVTYQREYAWFNNGLLVSRTESESSLLLSGSPLSSGLSTTSSSSTTTVSSSTKYNFYYDSLRQLTRIGASASTVESYAYDAAGNLTSMRDASGANWTYAATGTLNQITGRTSDRGGNDTYTYDAAGRVKTWVSGPRGTLTYYYDGLGRLRGVDRNGAWQMVLDYDAQGNLVRRADNNPFTASPSYAYKFREWRHDERTGTTIEADGDMVATETDAAGAVSREWLFKDYDGHAVMSFDDAGAVLSRRRLGAYGATVSSSGSTWDWNSYHGAEDTFDLFSMGQRHLMKKDGQWLQPEPLLYLGIPADILADPLRVATYRYARNTPTTYSDLSGFVSDEDLAFKDEYGYSNLSPGTGVKDPVQVVANSVIGNPDTWKIGIDVVILASNFHPASKIAVTAALVLEKLSEPAIKAVNDYNDVPKGPAGVFTPPTAPSTRNPSDMIAQKPAATPRFIGPLPPPPPPLYESPFDPRAMFESRGPEMWDASPDDDVFTGEDIGEEIGEDDFEFKENWWNIECESGCDALER